MNPTAQEKMMELARSFPALSNCPEVEQPKGLMFNLASLDQWIIGGGAETEAARHAGRFLLFVAMGPMRGGFLSGPFDLRSALLSWSNEDRAAFAAWAADPLFL